VLERDGVIDKDPQDPRRRGARRREGAAGRRPGEGAEERDKLVEDYDKGVQDGTIPRMPPRGSTRCSPTSTTPWTTSSAGRAACVRCSGRVRP
jgi:hypothetical protein